MGILSLPGFHVHELLSTRAAEFASCRGGSELLGAAGLSTWASSPACICLSVEVRVLPASSPPRGNRMGTAR